LAVAEKDIQQVRKDNQVLAQYINARRKKEETRKKETHKKAMEGQSFKDVQTWTK
jgi:hypothetical protein